FEQRLERLGGRDRNALLALGTAQHLHLRRQIVGQSQTSAASRASNGRGHDDRGGHENVILPPCLKTCHVLSERLAAGTRKRKSLGGFAFAPRLQNIKQTSREQFSRGLLHSMPIPYFPRKMEWQLLQAALSLAAADFTSWAPFLLAALASVSGASSLSALNLFHVFF